MKSRSDHGSQFCPRIIKIGAILGSSKLHHHQFLLAEAYLRVVFTPQPISKEKLDNIRSIVSPVAFSFSFSFCFTLN